MQQPYRFVTLGGLRLERADGAVVTGVAAQQRALAVLAAIAVAGARGVSRDWLVALLWPDSEEERARHVLAQLLYNLRRGLDAPSPVAGAGRQLWLDRAVVQADVRTFQDALRDGDDARALGAYGGALLEGVYLAGAPATFEEWVERERARLAALHRAALAREADRLATAGNHAADARAAVMHASHTSTAPPAPPPRATPSSAVVVRHDGPVAAMARRPAGVRWRRLTMLALVVVIGVVTLLVARRRAMPAPPRRSIVVLSFLPAR